jgi:signal recognition particle GTPase
MKMLQRRKDGTRRQSNAIISLVSVFVGCSVLLPLCDAFVPYNSRPTTFTTSTSTELSMVFDFFRDRSKEGLDQLGNLADSAKRGQLGKGLADASSYTTETNKVFADGLAKSRNRLLMNVESLFTGVSPERVLDDLQDILLQADLGISTAEDVVAEVKSLREDSSKMLTRQDLFSIMRGKLIEALDTGKPGAIQFSTDDCPTVLFIMGVS